MPAGLVPVQAKISFAFLHNCVINRIFINSHDITYQAFANYIVDKPSIGFLSTEQEIFRHVLLNGSIKGRWR